MKVNLTDRFLGKYRELIRTEMIPYQWRVLNDEIEINIERERNDDSIPNEKSHCLENFRIAAGLKEGHHYGWVFQDSDLYKWLEAVAYSLKFHPDKELEALADDAIELIGAAQEDDGYLSTYFTISAPNKKFKRLYESHELYCAGHYIEAACAYYETTGKRAALDIAVKLADYLDGYFGPDKHFGYDGHEEIEIGLMKLYKVTGTKRYMDLAEYFLSVRGTDTGFLERQRIEDGAENAIIAGLTKVDNMYLQDHMPPVEQSTAEGHAVRLVYMCEAMAHLASASGNKKMYEACRRIYRNIADKRMYITGGIGSTFHGERFTFDYDLPNDTMYCETCASIGLFHFMYRMMECEPLSEYADVMERALYNTVIAGMALDGKHFFYVNPLEADPESYVHDPGKSHVKPVRAQWLGCACCPPNLARCLTSVENYIYTVKDDVIYVNLYAGSDSEIELTDTTVHINVETDYPVNGNIRFKVLSEGRKSDFAGNASDRESGKAKLALRIPGWADNYSLIVSGQNYSSAASDENLSDGYLYIDIHRGETIIEFTLNMEPVRWYTNANVKEDIGKTALMRGPLVYCMEEADNGPDIFKSILPYDAELKYEFDESLLGGVGTITADGYVVKPAGKALHTRDRNIVTEPAKLKYIPYYAWANRGEGRMQVYTKASL